MACSDNVCGTGGWSGPLPGDPSNNSVLSATPAYGGIDVTWSYPTQNPEAVAHTILYRGTTATFEWAIQHKICAGDNFYDAIPKAQIREYFYWIQIVSVNGTVGDPIGPASAVPKASILEIIEDLTGQIDAGVLAESLRSEIESIATVQGLLSQEVQDRLSGNAVLAEALAAVQSETGEALTYINQEIINRTSANEAMLDSINVMSVGLSSNSAAIINEQAARVAADNAATVALTGMQSSLQGNIASAQTTLQTNINTVNGKVTDIGALYTAKVDVNGLVGGFGVYNNGAFVEAGFDVDRFWIGRTTNKTKPFIIDNGVVYITNAAIQNGAITNAKIGNTIQSVDYSSGMAGWKIDKTGGMEMNNATFRGTLNVKSASSGARTEISNDCIKVYGNSGNLLIKLGNLNA